MNSKASWEVNGVDRSARNAAEMAASQAGLDLGAWLNQTLLKKVPARPAPADASQARIEGRCRLDQALEQLTSHTGGAAAPTPMRANDGQDRSPKASLDRSSAAAEASPPDWPIARSNSVAPAGPIDSLEQRAKADPGSQQAPDAARDAAMEQRFAELSAQIDAGRTEMVGQVRRTVEQHLEPIERALGEMGARVHCVEQRSAKAGRAMLRTLLQTGGHLARKVEDGEQQAKAAIGQLAAGMARLGESLESRVEHAAAAGSASNRLDAEVARITLVLAGKVAETQMRAASDCDDLSAKLALVSEQLRTWRERASSELVEHIQQSEMRAALLLDDARQRVQRELAEPGRETILPSPAMAISNPGADGPSVVPFGRDRRVAGARRLSDRGRDFWRV
jgi:hypothetical protein